mmetsp:Transcript_58146/g.185041  ORF Transcript_58146/g.185041 Transcript_58146/m.185041 type:complete len:266 (+) Transcript_58146:101-898(+)
MPVSVSSSPWAASAGRVRGARPSSLAPSSRGLSRGARARIIICKASKPSPPSPAKGTPIPAKGSITTTAKVAAPPAESFKQFGRTWWPAFAGLELVALIGAAYNGRQSRLRRLQLEELTTQLTDVNSKLRLISSKGQGDIMDSMDLPSPTSVLAQYLSTGRDALGEGQLEEALTNFKQAQQMVEAEAVVDQRSLRSALRGQAAVRKEQGSLQQAVALLERVRGIAEELEDESSLVDVYGTLGDLYSDLGDLEAAGAAYDKYISLT